MIRGANRYLNRVEQPDVNVFVTENYEKILSTGRQNYTLKLKKKPPWIST